MFISFRVLALVVLGISVTKAHLKVAWRRFSSNNSWITTITSSLIIDQATLKNLALKPYMPDVFLSRILLRPSQISWFVIGWIKLTLLLSWSWTLALMPQYPHTSIFGQIFQKGPHRSLILPFQFSFAMWLHYHWDPEVCEFLLVCSSPWKWYGNKHYFHHQVSTN